MEHRLAFLSAFSLCIVLLFGAFVMSAASAEDDEEFLWVRVDVADPAVSIEGRWLDIEDDAAYRGREVTTTRAAAYAEFTFRGTGILWLGSTGINRGQADVYLNDELVAEGVDAYREEGMMQEVLFRLDGLDEGEYTIRIDPTGERHEDATMANLNIDAFAYIPTLADTIDSAREAILKARIGAPDRIGEALRSYHTSDTRNAFEEVISEAETVLEGEDPEEEELRGAIVSVNRAAAEFEASSIEPVFPDLSGHGNHGFVWGDPIWVPGRTGKALLFDGDDDIVAIEHNEELPISNQEAYTIELWVHGRRGQPDLRVFSEGSPEWNPLFNMGTDYQAQTGQADIYIRTDDGTAIVQHVRSEMEPFDGTWHHIAWVDEWGDARMYIDGELDPADFSYEKEELTLTNSSIGGIIRAQTSHHFEGVIDEVRVWNRARTEEEILETMHTELSGDEEGLVGYWNFNELMDPDEGQDAGAEEE